jgi:hypothetical protein
MRRREVPPAEERGHVRRIVVIADDDLEPSVMAAGADLAERRKLLDAPKTPGRSGENDPSPESLFFKRSAVATSAL